MIRRVAFGKAIFAGAAGALAWEIGLRLLILMGLPLFDLVYMLGTMVLGLAQPWQWWPIGMALHATVGAIWTIFYAYFFWSEFNLTPPLQGGLFSLGPTILAGLIMVPQLGFMHELILQGKLPYPGLFATKLGWGGPVGIVLGHLIFGVTMGSLYVRPVGSRVRGKLAHG